MTSTEATATTLCLRVTVPDADAAERLMAEAWSAGALGIEEAEAEEGVRLDIYAARSDEAAQRALIEAARPSGARLDGVAPVVETDWSEAWKAGLSAIVVSDRLVVRPSFVPFEAAAAQRVLVVDPGQAFGTGGHASTRLLLEWIDALARDEGPGRRVLDVGTGSGVLALAAVALGAGGAVGHDLDPVAVREAAAVVRDNALENRVALYVGGIEAVGEARFDLVLANLLRNEMLPIAASLAAAVAPGGRLALAGLLERDADAVVERFEALGLRYEATRRRRDDSGETWSAPVLRRPA